MRFRYFALNIFKLIALEIDYLSYLLIVAWYEKKDLTKRYSFTICKNKIYFVMSAR